MMGIERDKNREKAGAINFALVLFLAAIFPAVLYAQASVVLQKPLPTQTSDYGMRMHPVQKVLKPHKGVDYRAQTPTEVPITGPISWCGTKTGYGIQGQVAHACGVVERFSHLSSCGNGKIITGNTGVGTAPHLHYEISIDGTLVDPNEAYGKNLCDPAVRKALIEDAQKQLQGRAGGGGGATGGSSAPAPTPKPTPVVVHVPPGGTDPDTGQVNQGSGYYYTKDPDGTVTRNADLDDLDSSLPILPPTTSNLYTTIDKETPETGCAADTWRAMINQAVLETRREHIMNQRFIAKADSVFAYSCFSDAIANAGNNLGVFSESQRWVNLQVDLDGGTSTINKELGQYSLDGAITNAAMEPYEAHMHVFDHDWLGGQASGPPQPASPPTGNPPQDEDEVDSAQVYAPCDTMGKVWNLAKCMNVTDDPLFYRFEELITNDPRVYPQKLLCNNTGITQDMIDIARNKSTDPAKKIEISVPDMYMTLLHPDDETCAPPIPTGVQIFRQEGKDQITTEVSYTDGLCITPGCSYQNAGHSGLGTCEVKAPSTKAAPTQPQTPAQPTAPGP